MSTCETRDRRSITSFCFTLRPLTRTIDVSRFKRVYVILVILEPLVEAFSYALGSSSGVSCSDDAQQYVGERERTVSVKRRTKAPSCFQDFSELRVEIAIFDLFACEYLQLLVHLAHRVLRTIAFDADLSHYFRHVVRFSTRDLNAPQDRKSVV